LLFILNWAVNSSLINNIEDGFCIKTKTAVLRFFGKSLSLLLADSAQSPRFLFSPILEKVERPLRRDNNFFAFVDGIKMNMRGLDFIEAFFALPSKQFEFVSREDRIQGWLRIGSEFRILLALGFDGSVGVAHCSL